MLFATVSLFHIDPPSNTTYIIGGISVYSVDENGGKFYMSEHGVTVTIPEMAVPSGMRAKIKFAATLIAPVRFTNNAKPVSALIWLCMNVALQKPIKLQVPHYVNVKNESQSKTLQFAKSFIHSCDSTKMETMNVIEGGIFPVGESYGTIEINHFCFYCIQSIEAVDIPNNHYQIVTMKEIQPNIAENLWIIHICIIPSLPTCFKVLCYVYM